MAAGARGHWRVAQPRVAHGGRRARGNANVDTCSCLIQMIQMIKQSFSDCAVLFFKSKYEVYRMQCRSVPQACMRVSHMRHVAAQLVCLLFVSMLTHLLTHLSSPG